MPWYAPVPALTIGGTSAWPIVAGTAAALVVGSIGAVTLSKGPPPAVAAPSGHTTPPPPPPVSAAAPAVPVGVPITSEPVAPHAATGNAVPASFTPRQPVAPRAAAAAVSHTNYLAGDDGSLNTGVGTYADCSGNSIVPTGEAEILTCVTGRLYFVGHNAGVFTPLTHMGAGSGLTYWDARGKAHHYQVVGVRASWNRANGPPPPLQGNVVAQFQTCATPDGSTDRILDAVGDPADAVAPVVAAAAPIVAPAPGATRPVVGPTTSGMMGSSNWAMMFGGQYWGRH